MRLIEKDLSELHLGPYDLPGMFLGLMNPDGVRELKKKIQGQYRALVDDCDPEHARKIRRLISQTVVLGAMRGLQWGEALSKRQGRRKDDQSGKEWALLKHPSIVELLRKKSPPVSMLKICEALDRRGEPIPWRVLPGKDKVDPYEERLWASYAKKQFVKSLITRARNKVAEIDEDCVYLRTLSNSRKQFTQDVDAVKKEVKGQGNSEQARLFAGSE